ncbi:MAG: hypothetical protein JXP73_11955 [Deltaproteobacteria bacterium]|nr:hypothetical protein [Deltaproteobacteria bacterium]
MSNWRLRGRRGATWLPGLALAVLSACGRTEPIQTVRCPAGQHDGGDGKCVSESVCSEGYYDDGNGGCWLPDTQSGSLDVYLPATARRQLDMLFMIDNSPGMSGKVSKMNAQFPKLLAALKDPVDAALPDLRIALISSDLGTGGGFRYGACAPTTLPDGTVSFGYGDLGRFQMRTSPEACTFDAGALFLEYKNGAPVNYPAGVDINGVFACLASNLGELGCGEEHQLQAFEFALVARGVGNEEQQQAFLRGSAVLALIFITDEDDCSAATNDGMFGDFSALRGESASLRCATRGHECGGRKLTEAPPGYPTVASFSHPFADCKARTDTCANTTDGDPEGTDTSVPTDCSPLKDIKYMADEIKALKDDPDRQILVAGIFGWPLSDADMATAKYKIDLVPNPNTADPQHPMVYDYWPVCYDPDHAPNSKDEFDPDASGWAATGGLRNAAYVDEFGKNGLKFSICQRDYADSMTTIGRTLAGMFQNACIDFDLADVDEAAPGLQAQCSVFWRFAVPDPGDPSKSIWQEGPPLPSCPDGATAATVVEDCWRLVGDTSRCPKNGQRLDVLRAAGSNAGPPALDPATKIHARCRV